MNVTTAEFHDVSFISGAPLSFFSDDPEWRENITSVRYEGEKLTATDDYLISSLQEFVGEPEIPYEELGKLIEEGKPAELPQTYWDVIEFLYENQNNTYILAFNPELFAGSNSGTFVIESEGNEDVELSFDFSEEMEIESTKNSMGSTTHALELFEIIGKQSK
ncbi:hypothetical protein SAMN04487944_11852 [Gracilibacillus ureilyticus]|uniref:Uncharacterized protein n=1 Tax=Gracilibacillus ureilyticus TaxID=531814 RepID=A0A1H9UM84_9BACI|nr:hypothetical protein [Gracilibacillus ureilyticus]SES10418.1 hypothetical protein SAMN04487944_11852 [Gracilibacillus ureilyticus]